MKGNLVPDTGTIYSQDLFCLFCTQAAMYAGKEKKTLIIIFKKPISKGQVSFTGTSGIRKAVCKAICIISIMCHI